MPGILFSLQYFIFFLLYKLCRDAAIRFLRGQKQCPKIFHEYSCILSIQKASHIDLHFLRAGILFLFQLVIDKLYYDVVFYVQHFGYLFAYPWP